MTKKLIAEFVGTFTLALVVLLSSYNPIFPTPILAGLTLMLFVYLVGPISGCHINPAVSIGAMAVRRITTGNAIKYISAQLLGAFAAFGLMAGADFVTSPVPLADNPSLIFEFIGMVLFTFAIGSVVLGKATQGITGVAIGMALFLGIMISVFGGASGILNPAVAAALQVTQFGYYLAQIAGGILGFGIAKYLYTSK